MVFGECKASFQEADRRYPELHGQSDAGAISDEEFDEQLKELIVLGDEGRWWAKSRRTGEWHFYDGTKWVRAKSSYEPSKPSGESEPSVHKPSIDELICKCARYDGQRFYVGNARPGRKLAIARLHFPIPANERVAALLDTSSRLGSVLGLAKCEAGFRWCSGAHLALVTLQGFLVWRDFAEVSIEVRPQRWESMYRLDIGKGNELLAQDRDIYHDRLVQLLLEIQSLIKASPTGESA